MECPYIPSISYAQLDEQLNNKIIAKRIPIDGSFELTLRCNLRCAHCYCNLPSSSQDAISKELKTEEIFDIFDQIAEAGCLWLLITGGEPLLRKDFLEIYAYAKKKGFLISLFTNGTLLTPDIADYLAEWPPFEVEITLYGVTHETHEKITRIPGSFKQCNRGIDLLMERKIPLRLKTMAMTLNQSEFLKIKEYAEGLGVKFRFDPELNSRLEGSKTPCNFRLSPEEVIKLDFSDKKIIEGWKEFCRESIGPPESDNLYICGAGVSLFHIDPYGQLSLCMMSRHPSYDLVQGSFREGWHNFLPRLIHQKPKSDYKCGQCELISLCSQCPGWAWVENGDLETPVEYLCQIAHLRAEAFRT
ncbi:MAG: radical SAM protein [Candidatus Aminicenantes bacterium]|nr:MAG: radical SAM protein [Candidatus Aminicenantes bacterium]